MTTYNHLAPEERATVMIMLEHQFSMRKIAEKLSRYVSTISRELSRNNAKPNAYHANKEQSWYVLS